VVDDDDMVRTFVMRALQGQGKHVQEAARADAGLKAFLVDPNAVELLVSDVEMPGTMDGPQAYRAMVTARADLRVLFMSGRAQIPESAQVRFLHKPFGVQTLIDKLRDPVNGDWLA
jgi:FixJ family two-component response regulator